MTEPKKLKWEFLESYVQEKYLERARYMIERGYINEDDSKVEKVAKRLYTISQEGYVNGTE